jgi:hypothetical protein
MTEENEDADEGRDIEDEPPFEGVLVHKGPLDDEDEKPR